MMWRGPGPNSTPLKHCCWCHCCPPPPSPPPCRYTVEAVGDTANIVDADLMLGEVVVQVGGRAGGTGADADADACTAHFRVCACHACARARAHHAYCPSVAVPRGGTELLHANPHHHPPL